jgi:hypothetical protein
LCVRQGRCIAVPPLHISHSHIEEKRRRSVGDKDGEQMKEPHCLSWSKSLGRTEQDDL